MVAARTRYEGLGIQATADGGVIVVLVAGMLVVILGMAALAIDVGSFTKPSGKLSPQPTPPPWPRARIYPRARMPPQTMAPPTASRTSRHPPSS